MGWRDHHASPFTPVVFPKSRHDLGKSFGNRLPATICRAAIDRSPETSKQ
jgi:hypothetical protein